jgi:hypothetical protein
MAPAANKILRVAIGGASCGSEAGERAGSSEWSGDVVARANRAGLQARAGDPAAAERLALVT